MALKHNLMTAACSAGHRSWQHIQTDSKAKVIFERSTKAKLIVRLSPLTHSCIRVNVLENASDLTN